MRPTRHLGPSLVVLALATACSGANDQARVVDATPAPDDGVLASAPVDTADIAQFDFTATIRITDDGFVPSWAVAVFGETLTFVNDTDETQTVRFTNGVPNVDGPGSLGPIPPGGEFSLDDPLSAAISLVYESSALPGRTGRLQVDPGVENL